MEYVFDGQEKEMLEAAATQSRNSRKLMMTAGCQLVQAAVEVLHEASHELHNDDGCKLGSKVMKRKRLDLPSFFDSLSDDIFRRMYRMDRAIFNQLYEFLEPHMPQLKERTRGGKTPNGDILNINRLSMALRWAAGGDKYDISALHGVHPNEVHSSLWIVVDAIHDCGDLDISFPKTHEEQQAVAEEIRQACHFCLSDFRTWLNF